ncbi:MAG: EamA family transporter [Acidimicrobiales bacterium]|nr:EamA family transporter [Acidimicrobiales bacterium]
MWGTTWAAIRFSLEGYPPFLGAGLRFGVAAVVLLLAAAIARVPLGRERRERGLWILNGLFTFVVSYGVVYWSEQWVPSGLGSVLFATFPLFVALLAHLFLPGERIAATSTAGILLGFAGVAVIFSEDLSALGGSEVGLAALVMLISPISAAVGSVAVKRWGRGLHPLSTTAPPMLLAALVLGGGGVAVGEPAHLAPSTASTVALLYLGIFGSALTFGLYFWLLEHLSATRLSLMTYLIPVVAVSVGTFWLGEPMTPRVLLGAALVVAGVALASRR